MNNHYAVAYSGHGSQYRFDMHPDCPERMTLQEAHKKADAWCSSACSIAGGAIVIDMRTMQRVFK